LLGRIFVTGKFLTNFLAKIRNLHLETLKLPWRPLTVGAVAGEGIPLVAGVVVGEEVAVGNRGNRPVARGGGIGVGETPYLGAFARCTMLVVGAVVARTPCSGAAFRGGRLGVPDVLAGSWAACRGVACPGGAAWTFLGAFQVGRDACQVDEVAFQVEKVALLVACRAALAYLGLLRADLVVPVGALVALVDQAAVEELRTALVALPAASAPLAEVLAAAFLVEFGPLDRVAELAIGAGSVFPAACC